MESRRSQNSLEVQQLATSSKDTSSGIEKGVPIVVRVHPGRTFALELSGSVQNDLTV